MYTADVLLILCSLSPCIPPSSSSSVTILLPPFFCLPYHHVKGQELYAAALFWDQLYMESQAKGKWLMGRLFVTDVDGLSWSRFMRARPPLKKMSALMTDRFPEGARKIFIINVSWLFYAVWKIFKRFLPASTVAKVCLFKKGADHMTELQKYIDINEIPTDYGGSCPVPWPYGQGGDVPHGTHHLI